MNDVHFSAGAVIFRPGDPGIRAYLIRQGTVELLKTLDAPAPVAVLGAGEVFGEMSLIEDRPHALFARAASAVTAQGLTRDEFERLLTADPATFRTYLRTLFERLRLLSSRFEQAYVEPAPSRGDLVVAIHPLTRRAAETLPEGGMTIVKFPFRIGRAAEAKEHDRLDLNDLWLLDREPFHVSRNHAAINQIGGAVLVEDRGSTRGTLVNHVAIGARNAHTHARLEEGDNVVVLGGQASPYQFRIHVSNG